MIKELNINNFLSIGNDILNILNIKIPMVQKNIELSEN